MTRVYLLTPVADQDLVAIWSNTCGHHSSKQADKYLSELEICFIELAKYPELGKARPEIKMGYRSFVKNHHLIFYRYHQERIEIIRVLHERMDIKTKLRPE